MVWKQFEFMMKVLFVLSYVVTLWGAEKEVYLEILVSHTLCFPMHHFLLAPFSMFSCKSVTQSIVCL